MKCSWCPCYMTVSRNLVQAGARNTWVTNCGASWISEDLLVCMVKTLYQSPVAPVWCSTWAKQVSPDWPYLATLSSCSNQGYCEVFRLYVHSMMSCIILGMTIIFNWGNLMTVLNNFPVLFLPGKADWFAVFIILCWLTTPDNCTVLLKMTPGYLVPGSGIRRPYVNLPFCACVWLNTVGFCYLPHGWQHLIRLTFCISGFRVDIIHISAGWLVTSSGLLSNISQFDSASCAKKLIKQVHSETCVNLLLSKKFCNLARHILEIDILYIFNYYGEVK